MRFSTEKLIAVVLALQKSFKSRNGNATTPYKEIKFNYPITKDENIEVSIPKFIELPKDYFTDGFVPYPVEQPPTPFPKDYLIIDPEIDEEGRITFPYEPREESREDPREDPTHEITIPVENNTSFNLPKNYNSIKERSSTSSHIQKRGIIMAIPKFIKYCNLVIQFGHIPWAVAKLPERLFYLAVEALIQAYEDEEPMMDQGEVLLKKIFKRIMDPIDEEFNGHLDNLKIDINFLLYFILRPDLSRAEKVDVLICLLADLDTPEGLLPQEWPDYLKTRDMVNAYAIDA